jgi:hypothetical protein
MNAESALTIGILFAALGGLIFAIVRIILNHYLAHAGRRLDAIRHENCDLSHRVGNDLAKLAAELPRTYVKREDWIRFGAVIDAKFDTMREELEAVREKIYGQPQS